MVSFAPIEGDKLQYVDCLEQAAKDTAEEVEATTQDTLKTAEHSTENASENALETTEKTEDEREDAVGVDVESGNQVQADGEEKEDGSTEEVEDSYSGC